MYFFGLVKTLTDSLSKSQNIIFTPHLGASTIEAQEKVAIQISDQISDYLLKGSVINSLNTPSVSLDEAPVLKPFLKPVLNFIPFSSTIYIVAQKSDQI